MDKFSQGNEDFSAGPGTSKKARSHTYTATEDAQESSRVLLPTERLESKVPLEKKRNKRKKKYFSDNEESKYKFGLFGLFRFATKVDVTLMCTGLVFSIIHGASFPILALVFGQMTDSFIAIATTLQTNTTISEQINTKAKAWAFFYFLGSGDEPLNSSVDVSLAPLSPDVNTDREHFTSYLAHYSLNYLYIGIGVLFAAFIQTLCWELSCERQVYRMRKVAFSQILRQDIPWYDTRLQHNLANMLSDDVERVREGIGCKLSMVTQYLSTFVCGIVVGVLVNWRLTSMLLLVAPVLIAASAYLAKLTAGSAAREQIKYGLAGAVAEEVLSNVRTVAAFGKETSEIHRYNVALESGRKLAMHKYVVLAWGLTLVFFLLYAQYGLAFYYGAVLLEEHAYTPGTIFTVFFSVLSGAFTLGNALPYVNSVATAFGSASSVFNIIDRVPQIDPYNNTGTRLTAVKGHIEFQNVHFSYPSRPDVKVLKGLTLDIQPGQTVALVGPSGSGKSTVIQLLQRFYDVSYGTVSLDGTPLKDLNIQWLRSHVAVVSQESVLFGVSISDNIRYGREGVSQDDIEMAATMANAHGFIDQLPQGYDTLLGERGAQLSGGQKQRVTLARALVRDPAVLLLDEATSALDIHSEHIVQEALDRAMLGRTTVVVAHRLSTVRKCDLIYTLDGGVLVEQGSHEELMRKQGLYCQLVNTQAVFHSDDGYLTDDIDFSQNVTANFILLPSTWMSVFLTPVPRMSELEMAPLTPRREFNTSQLSLFPPQDQPYLEGEVRKVSLWSLLKMHKPECGWLLLGLLGSSMSGAIMPVFAYFYGEVFATFTKTGPELMRAAVFWSAMFVVLGFFAAVSIWLEIVTMTLAVEKLVMRLRVMAFRNILRQPIGWFDLTEHSSGRLISRLARDAPIVKGAAGLRLGQLLGSLVTLVSALSIAFLFGWKLALVLLLIVPLISMGAYHQTLMMRHTQQRDAELMDDAGRVASECIQNIRTVQALCKEKLFVQLYMERLVRPFREAKKQAVMYSVIFALSQAVIYVMYSAAFRFGAYLIQINDMTPAEVYRVFFAMAFCAASVGTSSAYVQDYNRAKMAASQIFRLIDRPSETDALSPVGLKPVIKGLLTYDSVCFHYPNRPDVSVLQNLSLTVRPGQTLAVVGQSGCGKSTIIALLEQFYQPTSGTIKVDGIDIRDINIQHLRLNIGLVTQEPALFNRTIRENIAYGLVDGQSADMSAVVQAARDANCHSFISQLPQGYETIVGDGGVQLSGGQRQRVAIARALIRNPRILLLDEATSALDTDSEKVVQEALDKAREGRTCIVIAHRLSTIRNADIIAVLDQGKIREMGSHNQLQKQRGLYYRLLRAQPT